MSFIFDASKPVSPERQKVAKAMLERERMSMLAPAPMPTDVGSGLAALGQGIANGLEMRSLDNQANAPIDQWADMRQLGTQQPTMGGPMMGFGSPIFDGLKKLFR